MACNKDEGFIKFPEESKNFRDCNPIREAQTQELRKLPVTRRIAILIKKDIVNFWEDLGAFLRVAEGDLDYIKAYCAGPIEKVDAVLQKWRDMEGLRATVGCLETALILLEKQRIADKLLDIVRKEKRSESQQKDDGSEERQRTFSSPLEEGEVGHRQDTERGSPETMPSSAREPANAPRTRNVEQSEKRDETGSEQGKLYELKESIQKVREMNQAVTRLKSKVDELPRSLGPRNTGRKEPLITMHILLVEVAALKEVIEITISERDAGYENSEVLREMFEKVRKVKEDLSVPS